MEIRRFFVTPDCINGNEIVLRGDEFAHMTKVLRYKAGYKAIVCVNDGCELHCTIDSIYADSAVLKIDERIKVDEKSARVTLFAGVLKNNKTDFALQKAVELGIDSFVPFVSANSAEMRFSTERGRRIALEAAKQCGSAYLTEVGETVNFADVAAAVKNFDVVYFAYEGEKERKIRDVARSGGNVAIVVGPEGGFTLDEKDALERAGARTVTLGKRILRAETASIVACAILLDAMGELDHD